MIEYISSFIIGLDWDRSRLHSHQSVEQVVLVDLVLQFLQLLVLLYAVVVHQDHFLLPHVEISKASPEESLLAHIHRVEMIIHCHLHLILKLNCFLLRIGILAGIVEEIINKEVDFVSAGNGCYSKVIVDLDLSLLIVASSSKEHLDNNKDELVLGRSNIGHLI